MPYMGREGRAVFVSLDLEARFVLVMAILEGAFCGTYICAYVVLMVGSCVVNNCVLEAVTFKRTCAGFLAIALF